MAKPKLQISGATNVAQIVQKAVAVFEKSGVPSPKTDAIALVSNFFQLQESDVRHIYELKKKVIVFKENCDELLNQIERRMNREPLQHILKTAYFFGLELTVGPGVFIPRPETEVLVEKCVNVFTKNKKANMHIVDLCSGSGSVGLAIAAQLNERNIQSEITLIEKSVDAYSYLVKNVEKYAANFQKTKINTVFADIFDYCETIPDNSLDEIVSNPPYIPQIELDKNKNVEVAFDPIEALVGGEKDGLEIPKRMIESWSTKLKKGGHFAVEVHDNDAKRAGVALKQNGFINVHEFSDLNLIERFVIAEKG